MPPFTDRLADGWARATGHLPLALVPLLLTLLQTDRIADVAAFDGVQFSFRLGLPGPVATLWQFVSVPSEGVNVTTPLPVGLDPGSAFGLGGALGVVGVVLVLTPLFAAFRAGLAAGYLGSVRQVLATGDYSFGTAVLRHFLPLFVYELLKLALGVLLVLPAIGLVGLGGFGSGGLGGVGLLGIFLVFVVGVPVFLALAYLFYATPFLIVLRGDGLLRALRGSYALAVEFGPHLRFAAGYCGLVFAVSLVATPVVVALGIVGVVFGAIAIAPLSLALAFATTRFVADVDPASPTFGDREGSAESERAGGTA